MRLGSSPTAKASKRACANAPRSTLCTRTRLQNRVRRARPPSTASYAWRARLSGGIAPAMAPRRRPVLPVPAPAPVPVHPEPPPRPQRRPLVRLQLVVLHLAQRVQPQAVRAMLLVVVVLLERLEERLRLVPVQRAPPPVPAAVPWVPRRRHRAPDRGPCCAAPSVDRHTAVYAQAGVHQPGLECGVGVPTGCGCGIGFAGDLEEVDAEEGGDEARKERDGVGRVVGVEALEEDDGRDDRGRREADIVHRVYAVHVCQPRNLLRLWENQETHTH